MKHREPQGPYIHLWLFILVTAGWIYSLAWLCALLGGVSHP